MLAEAAVAAAAAAQQKKQNTTTLHTHSHSPARRVCLCQCPKSPLSLCVHGLPTYLRPPSLPFRQCLCARSLTHLCIACGALLLPLLALSVYCLLSACLLSPYNCLLSLLLLLDLAWLALSLSVSHPLTACCMHVGCASCCCCRCC